MAERLDRTNLDEQQLLAAMEVADLALNTVENNYGTGFPHFRGGEEADLAFHGGYHTIAVPRDAMKVGAALGFSLPEMTTAYAAGRAHDIIQLKPRGIMEAESAEWFVDQMRRRGLPETMSQAGALAIRATEPIIVGNVVVGQMAEQLDYPSKSAERVAKSVACGDFGDMYRPKGPYLSHKIWEEIKSVKPGEEAPLEGFEDYLIGQVALLENYRFPLRKADKVLATHRREVMRYAQQVLAQVRRGDITSWKQLEKQDVDFMNMHS